MSDELREEDRVRVCEEVFAEGLRRAKGVAPTLQLPDIGVGDVQAWVWEYWRSDRECLVRGVALMLLQGWFAAAHPASSSPRRPYRVFGYAASGMRRRDAVVWASDAAAAEALCRRQAHWNEVVEVTVRALDEVGEHDLVVANFR